MGVSPTLLFLCSTSSCLYLRIHGVRRLKVPPAPPVNQHIRRPGCRDWLGVDMFLGRSGLLLRTPWVIDSLSYCK